MRCFQSLFALGLQASFTVAKILRDLPRSNVEVAEVDPKTNIDYNRQEIVFYDPSSDFEDVFRCSISAGKQLTFSSDKKFVSCCLAGQNLTGSPETSFDCCRAGHELTGSPEAGFKCCPTGQIYDGSTCREPKVEMPQKTDCSSGISEGKCYVFGLENGRNLGYDNRGWYATVKDGRNNQLGKFKLCKTEACNSGDSINPNAPFRIKDIHSVPNIGENVNLWLNNARDCGHIGKTAEYEKAGIFSITKWTKGKYCLGGFESGVSPTCGGDDSAARFNVLDPQSCIPVEVTEVPCDIHSLDNNCIWTDGSGRCPATMIFDGTSCVYVSNAGSVVCPTGSSWNGASCAGSNSGGPGKGQGITCPIGTSWNGQKCVGVISCPADSTWDGQKCVGIVNSGQANPGVTCPSGSSWNGQKCVGAISCPSGSVWNGQNCIGSVTTPPGNNVGQGAICPPGSTWDGQKCVGAISCPPGSTWNGQNCVNNSGNPPPGNQCDLKVTCPSGSTWDGQKCIGTISCPSGSIWNGQNCIGNVTPPTENKVNTTVTCPPGSTWDGQKCVGNVVNPPLDDNQKPIPPLEPEKTKTRPPKGNPSLVYPEKGDTSYDDTQFPCSLGKEKPCRSTEVQSWMSAVLPWGGAYQQPGPPKPFDLETNFLFPVIMSIVDVEAQSEHFLLKLDNEFLGETGGEDGYKNVYFGNYNDPEWCLTNGYTRGYFLIPAGKHKITIEWPQGTGKYKTNAGGNWWYGIAKYRFDRLCDANKCP